MFYLEEADALTLDPENYHTKAAAKELLNRLSSVLNGRISPNKVFSKYLCPDGLHLRPHYFLSYDGLPSELRSHLSTSDWEAREAAEYLHRAVIAEVGSRPDAEPHTLTSAATALVSAYRETFARDVGRSLSVAVGDRVAARSAHKKSRHVEKATWTRLGRIVFDAVEAELDHKRKSP